MKAMSTNQTIAWFNQRYKENSLELSPDFQRNIVWQNHQKNYLIETILLELPIPEIYVVNRITSSGDSKLIVVDGQQRLSTILEFVNSELKVDIQIPEYSDIEKFDDLSEDRKTKFWRYPMVIRDLEDSSDKDVRDLFQRLNKYPVKLNDQELRNAQFQGCFLNTIQELGDNNFWTTIGLFSPNDIRRMIDLEFIGILLSTMIGGIYNRKDRLDEFYRNYEDEFEGKDHYVKRFNNVLHIIDTALPDIRKTRWNNKADFFTLFVLLDSIQDSITNSKMIELVGALLHLFSEELSNAKNDPENSDEKFVEYLEAAKYATNDKINRILRLRILKQFFLNKMNEASPTPPAGKR